MIRIIACNETNDDHLAEVVADMQTLGAPTIRCVETANGLVAIEGSHRLAAADALGITPEIVVIGQDEAVEGASLNDIQGDVWTNFRYDLDSDATAHDFRVTGAQLAEFFETPSGALHRFED